MRDRPGVLAPPPLLFVAALISGLALENLWPLEGIGHRAAGGALFLAALLLMIWAMQTLRRAGTNVQTRKPSTTVVDTGPYRYTRNPIYIGFTGMLIGIGLAAGSVWTILMAVPFFALVDRGVIAREERYLSAKFGASYEAYRARVRRWI